ncbi:MAG: hypothetical protein AMS23_05520 [Bacteroides sp. SM1_62]|nr:MAG: hypothetical protein AMS26_09145 [Bacteroides sp. SM23_62]KPL24666.1 MAG: hypothetical protein AMS23_05520 [Bacteroides sp. SM1_62]
MVEVCPVNERQINENVTRLNALVTFIVVTVFIFTPYKWILFFLPLDFALRAWFQGRFSPIGRMNNYLVRSLNLGESLINEGPKLFAARIGLILSAGAVISFFAGLTVIAYVLGGFLVFFSFLEAVFGFCMACKIYPFIYRSRV